MAELNKITIDLNNNIIKAKDPSIGEVVIVVAGMFFRAIFEVISRANKSADSSNNEEISKRGRSGSS